MSGKTISSAGGEVWIQESKTSPSGIEYSTDKGANYNELTNANFPLYFKNTGTDTLKVLFKSNITMPENDGTFIADSGNIQFGDKSLNPGGTRPTISFAATTTKGLITINPPTKNSISVVNLIVDGVGTTLTSGNGWMFVGQVNGTGHTVVNCTVTGDIPENAGGIVGSVGTESSITIRGCSSTGYISGMNAGGFVGGGARGTVTIDQCYSSGAIGSQSGGIIGGVGSGSTITITKCYSTGNIQNGGGGIAAGDGESAAFNISNCYSEGAIAGEFTGGIIGYMGKTTTNITNCYTTGSIAAKCGGIAGFRGSGFIRHCYTTGASQDSGKGGIVGEAGVDNNGGMLTNNYSQAISGKGTPGWSKNNADTVLETGWIEQSGINQPFLLSEYGVSPFSQTTVNADYSLVQTAALTAAVNDFAGYPIATGYAYYLLGTVPTGVSIEASGRLTSSVVGTFTLTVYNTKNPYAVTTVTFTVTGGGGETSGACCLSVTQVNVPVSFTERDDIRAGILIARTAGNLTDIKKRPKTYAEFIQYKKALAFPTNLKG